MPEENLLDSRWLAVTVLGILGIIVAGATSLTLHVLQDFDSRLRVHEVSMQHEDDKIDELSRAVDALNAQMAQLQAAEGQHDNRLTHLEIRQDAVEADLKSDEAVGILRRGRH